MSTTTHHPEETRSNPVARLLPLFSEIILSKILDYVVGALIRMSLNKQYIIGSKAKD